MKIEKRDESKKSEQSIQNEQKGEHIIRVRSNLRAGAESARVPPSC